MYSTAEAERKIVAETAVALTTALHEQQIEATAVAEADSHAIPEAETLLLNQRDLAYQLALESIYNLNERPHLIQQGALLALEAVQRYPDARTVQSLTNALQLLPDHDTKILENSDDATWYTFSDDGRDQAHSRIRAFHEDIKSNVEQEAARRLKKSVSRVQELFAGDEEEQMHG